MQIDLSVTKRQKLNNPLQDKVIVHFQNGDEDRER